MSEKNQIFIINSLRFDGQIKHSWKARLIEQNGALLIFVGEFERDVVHSHLGLIKRGTISREFFWLDRWFNIFRFQNSDGTFRNFYCNINLPPKLGNKTLEYVDLDLDIVVWNDFRAEVLDETEFSQNAGLFGYSVEIVLKARETVGVLQEMIRLRTFPF